MTQMLPALAVLLCASIGAALAAAELRSGWSSVLRAAASYTAVLLAGLTASIVMTAAAEATTAWPTGLAVIGVLFLRLRVFGRREEPPVPRQLLLLIGPASVLFSLWITTDDAAIEGPEGWEFVAWWAAAILASLSVKTHFETAHEEKRLHRNEPEFVRVRLAQGWVGGVAELVTVLSSTALLVVAVRGASAPSTEVSWVPPWGGAWLLLGGAMGAAMAGALWPWSGVGRTAHPAGSGAVRMAAAWALPSAGVLGGCLVVVLRGPVPTIGAVPLIMGLLAGLLVTSSIVTDVGRLNLVPLAKVGRAAAATTGVGVGAVVAWLLAFGIRLPGGDGLAPVPTATTAVVGALVGVVGLAGLGAYLVRRMLPLPRDMGEGDSRMNVMQDALLFGALIIVVAAGPVLLTEGNRLEGGDLWATVTAVVAVVGVGVGFAFKANLDHLHDERDEPREVFADVARANGTDAREVHAMYLRVLRAHIYWLNGLAIGLVLFGIARTVILAA